MLFSGVSEAKAVAAPEPLEDEKGNGAEQHTDDQ